MMCVIPARGGSKRIPNKNIKDFHGKPMLQRAIETATKAMMFKQIIVSTDDEAIGAIAERCGAIVHWRAPELAVDDPNVGTVDVVEEVARVYANPELDKVICALYPCSPFVEPGHLFASLSDFLFYEDVYLCVAGTDYRDAGQFYWGTVTAWLNFCPIEFDDATKYLIPNAIDINTPDDWEQAEKLYEEI